MERVYIDMAHEKRRGDYTLPRIVQTSIDTDDAVIFMRFD
jgi:hypothetical protein